MSDIEAEQRRRAREYGKRPGNSWRMSCDGVSGDPLQKWEAQDVGTFDELVVDHWIHLERMNERVWWMRLGYGASEHTIHVTIDRQGGVEVHVRVGE